MLRLKRIRRNAGGGVRVPAFTPAESLLLLACRPQLSEPERAMVPVLARGVTEWGPIVWRAEHYRMLPMLHYWLDQSGALESVPADIASYIDAWVALSRARSQAQFHELGRILRALEDARIEYFLLKGSGLAVSCYPGPLLRPMQDLDFMIRPGDAWRVQQLLFDLGFRNGIWDSDSETFTPMRVTLTRAKLAASIELPPFTHVVQTRSPVPEELVLPQWRRQHIKCAVRADRLALPVFVDVHTNLAADVDLEDVWSGVRLTSLFGLPVRVQSATSLVWFIATRLYVEAFTYNTLKLSMFGDVYALLTKQADDIDWPQLLALAYKYGTRPALYYVLGQMSRLTDAQVPLSALALLQPRQDEVPLENDWGDLIPKLISRPLLHQLSYAAPA